MARRIRRSPSLTALRAFWAAAHHRSFAAAAEELHVTASAVSLRIRQLEDELEFKLFERAPKGLLLIPQGARLLPGIKQAFEHLKGTIASIDEPTPGKASLSISTAPSFATKWLLPRLGSFLERHPRLRSTSKQTSSSPTSRRTKWTSPSAMAVAAIPGLRSNCWRIACVRSAAPSC